MAAGRAAAAARKAKQERLLEQLRTAKESFRVADTSANIPDPKEADSKEPERLEHNRGWTPWIIGACLAGGALKFLPNCPTQMPQLAGPSKQLIVNPPGDEQLKASPDPFYME